MMKLTLAALAVALLVPSYAPAQSSSQSQPTEESKKLPLGSSAERKARMRARANSQAYTKKFDLSGLPRYEPREQAQGTLRVCGNNYVNDAPLGGYWKAAFEKLQPGVKVEYYTPTAAIAGACLYFDRADIGVNHELSFYDYLSHVRLKGFEPTSYSVFTGSFNYVGWQNNMVIIVNKDNPITKVTLEQLDGIFGSGRAGGWIGQNWHPELKRGADEDIRSGGRMGLTGEWANRHITPHGYAL